MTDAEKLLQQYFTKHPKSLNDPKEVTTALEEFNKIFKLLVEEYKKQPKEKQANIISDLVNRIKGPLASVLFTALSVAAQQGKVYDFEKTLLQILEEQHADSTYIAQVKDNLSQLDSTFKAMDQYNVELRAIPIPDALVPKLIDPVLVPKERGDYKNVEMPTDKGGYKTNLNKIAEGIILDSLLIEKTADIADPASDIAIYTKKIKDRFHKIEVIINDIIKANGQIDKIITDNETEEAAEALVNLEEGWEQGFKAFKV